MGKEKAWKGKKHQLLDHARSKWLEKHPDKIMRRAILVIKHTV